jgi:hypothetical protein
MTFENATFSGAAARRFWQNPLRAVSPFISRTHQVIPDFLKFIIVVAVLAGAVYGGALALATFPPEQSDVIRPLPHEKLRQD